jgi:conjugative relaxase-like TrwC/TraI family protein
MLRPHTAYSAYGVKKYFETADYYSQGNETVGRWFGKLAGSAFGLEGQVTKEAFGQLCDGINPATGERLTPRMNEHRRVGDDFVWSLPKDVGAWIMLLPPAERDAMLAMVERRVYQVMGMIEADVETRVRKDGAFHNRPGDGLVGAAFMHTTARPVEGLPSDPHPHWHAFCFNVTNDPEELRLKAADFANIYRDRPFYEAVFYSLVAEDFAKMGLPIERRADGKWGFAGLEPMGATFSKRTNEVEEEARRLNITDAAAKAKLGATTRSKKDKELSPEELREAWQAQLTDADREALAAIERREAMGGPAVTPAEAVAYAIAHCSEKLSVIPVRELQREALLFGLGHVTLEQIEAELPRQGVFSEVIDGQLMATTGQLQDEENAIVGFAARGQGAVEPVGVPDGLDRQLAGGKRLNDGQWAAVQGLLNSTSLVNLVEGPAGAGKSSLLAKYDEGMRKAGQDVHYFATTAKAAGVLKDDGFDDTETVAHLLWNEKLQAKLRGGHLVVDEVSMLGHKDAVRLFDVAKKNDLTLVLVGDPMQHGAVARGALMRVLKDYACLKPFRLTEIMRQESAEYRAAAKLFSEGKTLEGVEAIERLGWIREMSDDGDRYSHIAADYLQAMQDFTSLPENKRALIVSPTHAGAARITEKIRGELRHAGKLGEDHAYTRLVAVDASEPERGQAITYRPGDVIQFHQNAKGFKKGDRLMVADPANVPLAEAAKFSLYRPEAIAFAEGDRIRFTGTVKTLDGHTLKNGMTKGVAEILPDGNLKLDNGWVVDGKNAGHFRHGYVETSFGSQGSTVQRVIVDMPRASRGAIDQEQMYVSASRGKQWMRIYTDAIDDLKAAVQRSSAKLAALDLKRPMPQETPQQGVSSISPQKPSIQISGVTEKQPAKPRKRHRLRKHWERLRRLALLDRTRAAWEKRPWADHAVPRMKSWSEGIGRSNRPQPGPKEKEREGDHGFSR